ncbi:MAG: hypothetical protein HY321_12140 [Armatimonadetes bacterium]|nr:hypothetical protein [Armatimonadota bacterium]
MKPGKKDVRLDVLITGEELRALQQHTWLMAEAFGLDGRIERYKGTRPIGLYRWDLDCLLDVLAVVLEYRPAYPDPDSPERAALERLRSRLQAEYNNAFGR